MNHSEKKSLNAFCWWSLCSAMETIGYFDLIIPHPIFTIISYSVVFMYNRVRDLWAQKADNKQRKSMTLALSWSTLSDKRGGGILFAISYSLHFIDGDSWRVVCICVMWCRVRYADGINSGVQKSALVF